MIGWELQQFTSLIHSWSESHCNSSKTKDISVQIKVIISFKNDDELKANFSLNSDNSKSENKKLGRLSPSMKNSRSFNWELINYLKMLKLFSNCNKNLSFSNRDSSSPWMKNLWIYKTTFQLFFPSYPPHECSKNLYCTYYDTLVIK